MSARPWIAMLLLINYLMVVGMDCVNRPGDQYERIQVQTLQEGSTYQQCMYLRMDGLDAFLAESMARHYQDGPKVPPRHLITVVSGVNAHTLTNTNWQLLPPTARQMQRTEFTYQTRSSAGVRPIFIVPPRQA